MDFVALVIGWFVIGIVEGCLAGALVWAAWRFCPTRFDWHRSTAAYIDTPHGRFWIAKWIGFSRRRRPEGWFVGAIYLADGARGPKDPIILTKKGER